MNKRQQGPVIGAASRHHRTDAGFGAHLAGNISDAPPTDLTIGIRLLFDHVVIDPRTNVTHHHQCRYVRLLKWHIPVVDEWTVAIRVAVHQGLCNDRRSQHPGGLGSLSDLDRRQGELPLGAFLGGDNFERHLVLAGSYSECDPAVVKCLLGIRLFEGVHVSHAAPWQSLPDNTDPVAHFERYLHIRFEVAPNVIRIDNLGERQHVVRQPEEHRHDGRVTRFRRHDNGVSKDLVITIGEDRLLNTASALSRGNHGAEQRHKDHSYPIHVPCSSMKSRSMTAAAT